MVVESYAVLWFQIVIHVYTLVTCTVMILSYAIEVSLTVYCLAMHGVVHVLIDVYNNCEIAIIVLMDLEHY